MTSTDSHLVTDRRLSALSVVLVLGAIASLLDSTIVNVALDHLHTVFHASVADTQWVSSGYLLALAGVIPLTGWASERFGTKTIWRTAVAAFLVGSVLCGFAWDLPSLIGFRVLQGIGGGMILPVSMTILSQAAGPARIGRAMTAIALPGQLAPILGPVIGGAIVDNWSWHWLFFVNIPICVVALAMAVPLLPANERKARHPLDVRGFALLTPGLVGIAYGVSEAGGVHGFGTVSSWLPLAVGGLLVVCFALYALRTRVSPLIDVRLFAKRSFGLSSMITFLGGFSTYAAMFLLPLYYQEVRGYSPFDTGLLLIPQGVGTILYLLLGTRIAARFETKWIVLTGVVLTMIGTLPFILVGGSGGDVLLLAGQFVRGIGLGASSLPLMTVAFTSVPRPDVPRASAGFNVVQRVGAPFGVTVVAVIAQALGSSPITGGNVVMVFHATFWWVLAFSVVPLVLALFLPSVRRTPVAPVPAQVAAEA